MHEFSIAESIVKTVQNQLANKIQENEKLISITVKIGELTSVSKESLLFSFNIIKKNSIANDAEMLIKDIPWKCECNNCKGLFEVKDYNTACPNCNNSNTETISGNELQIVELEVE